MAPYQVLQADGNGNAPFADQVARDAAAAAQATADAAMALAAAAPKITNQINVPDSSNAGKPGDICVVFNLGIWQCLTASPFWVQVAGWPQ